MGWFYIDFKVIDHTSEFAAHLETTMICADSKEIAVNAFVEDMEGETYEIIGVREHTRGV